jgi:hypothetical protein
MRNIAFIIENFPKKNILEIQEFIKENKVEFWTKYIDRFYIQADKIIISKLFLQMINDSKKDKKICNLIYSIHKPIYFYSGFRDWTNNAFILNLKNEIYKKK